jgi:hypothetical protein
MHPSKSVLTLVQDIQSIFTSGVKPTEEQARLFGERVAKTIVEKLTRPKQEATGTFTLSQSAEPNCKLWYKAFEPEKAESFNPETLLMFLYGDLIEELVLFLAEVAGHEVSHRQKEVELEGVKGHIDAVIDGTLVDVKSCVPFSFDKFDKGTLQNDDKFGYIAQLTSYLAALKDTDLITTKKEAFFFAVDKQNGRMCLSKVGLDDDKPIREHIVSKCGVLDPSVKPKREFSPKPMGASGNMKLDTICAYCLFKKDCWKDANKGQGLLTYEYSNGPVHLTTVVKEPRVEGKF